MEYLNKTPLLKTVFSTISSNFAQLLIEHCLEVLRKIYFPTEKHKVFSTEAHRVAFFNKIRAEYFVVLCDCPL